MVKRICLQCGRPGFDLWVGKISWRRAWPPTPVSSPGESSWTEETGQLLSTGLQRVGHGLETRPSTAYSCHKRFVKKMILSPLNGILLENQLTIDVLVILGLSIWFH